MSDFFTRASSMLTDMAAWSVRITDLNTGEILWEHDPERVLKTASVGKIFLLAR